MDLTFLALCSNWIYKLRGGRKCASLSTKAEQAPLLNAGRSTELRFFSAY